MVMTRYWVIPSPSPVADPSSIGRTRRTPPPPLIGENIAFSCIFGNKVKLAILYQPKCGLRPLLLHILDPPLPPPPPPPTHTHTSPQTRGIHQMLFQCWAKLFEKRIRM